MKQIPSNHFSPTQLAPPHPSWLHGATVVPMTVQGLSYEASFMLRFSKVSKEAFVEATPVLGPAFALVMAAAHEGGSIPFWSAN